MRLVKKDGELRNIALTVKLTQSERNRLAELAQHYETSNADLLVWLVDEQLKRLRSGAPDQPDAGVRNDEGMDPASRDLQGIRKTLDQLVEQVANLTRS